MVIKFTGRAVAIYTALFFLPNLRGSSFQKRFFIVDSGFVRVPEEIQRKLLLYLADML